MNAPSVGFEALGPAQGSAVLERLFAAVSDKSARFVSNIDCGWVDQVWAGLSAQAAAARDTHADRVSSAALQAAYGVRWPSLTALAQRVHRLAVLPLADVLKVLQAVALYQRRAEVRRCIGRTARLAIIGRVGQAAFDVILAAPGADGSTRPGTHAGTNPDTTASSENETPFHAVPAHVLARSAFMALESSGLWACCDSHRLVSLCLAPDAVGTALACPPSAAVAANFQPLIHQLDLLFPEHAWLFGCDMDKALSA